MYYPILRGRQNELLAIRELLEAGKLSNVIPIVEPVKASGTLLSTITAFQDKDHPLALVQNPIVGDFAKDLEREEEFCVKYKTLLDEFSNLIPVFRPFIEKVPASAAGNPAMLFYSPEKRSEFKALLDELKPGCVILPSSEIRMKRRLGCKVISLDESYRVQPRNADYRNHDEDRITEENVYYRDDGYEGFSDYSVIGGDFSVGGFMPRVVALHLAYKNRADGGSIWLHHFTSSQDIPVQDIGLKFESALKALVEWADENNVDDTLGLKEFRELKEKDRFPGLGYAKKLAIKHHIELVDRSLSGDC